MATPALDNPAVLMSGEFKDGDEFCSAAAGWNIEFRQLDCGEIDAGLDVVLGQTLSVFRFDLKRRYHQLGSAPDGVFTFGLPDDCRKLNWYGKPMECDFLLNFNRRAGFDAVSDEDFGGHTFSIRQDKLQDAISSLDPSMQSDQVPEMSAKFEVCAADLSKMRGLARSYQRCLKNDAGTQLVYQEFEMDIAHVLAKSVCQSKGTEYKSSYAQRQRAVDRALQFIFSTREALNVSDIYKYSAVSWRTLDRAFKERFGVSPKQYIVAVRLAGARRELQVGSPGTKIADVANEWGFWHLGRFASDYNRMFGELPSDTLTST